jgi:ectoine hydroxylase
MKLTPEQLAQFDRDGYLFFPGQFRPEEIKVLTDAVPELYSRREVYNVREKGSDSVRTNFAAHMYSEPFARLGRHPRMVGPVQSISATSSTCTSSRSTARRPSTATSGSGTRTTAPGSTTTACPSAGDEHRDLPRRRERVQRPLMFIPGSHKKGVVDAKHDLTTTSYPLWTVDNALIAELVDKRGRRARRNYGGGLVSPHGPAGSMILFHGCLLHASGSNLSPFNRVAVYLSLNAVDNHIRRHKRPSTSATATSRRSRRCPTTACSRTTLSTCRGRTACRRARWPPPPKS